MCGPLGIFKNTSQQVPGVVRLPGPVPLRYGSFRTVRVHPDAHERSMKSSKVRVWDSSTGAVIATILGHSCIVTSLKFCASRNLLASASVDTCIRIWCSLRHTPLVTFRGHQLVVWTMRGDSHASAAKDESILIWDCHTWTQLVSLKGQWTGLASVAFSFSSAGDQIANVGTDGLLFM